MKNGFVNLLVRWLVLALGVALAAQLVPGINYDNGSALAVTVLLLSLFNALLKPLLVLFTLPFIVLTMGIGVWLINALLFLLVAKLVNGFHVSGYGAALLGALIVSVTNLVMNRVLASSQPPAAGRGPRRKDPDAIDV